MKRFLLIYSLFKVKSQQLTYKILWQDEYIRTGYGQVKPYPGSYGHYHEDTHHGGIYKTAESPLQHKDERLPIVDHFYDYDQQQLKERGSRLFERELAEDVVQPRNAERNQRSFAWHSVNNNK